MKECMWCEEVSAQEDVKDCYWVMPDGRRSVKILQVPSLTCSNCGQYLEDPVNQKVEDTLYISDLSSYPDEFTFTELLKAPVKNLFNYK